MSRPLLLLLGTGTALGFYFPLGKMALAQGVAPALWAAVISGGAGLVLLGVAHATEGLGRVSGGVLRFAVISGLISYVVPNFLTFLVIPQIGSGLTAVMFALSPLVTALVSTVLAVRPPSLPGLAAVGVGLAGALLIIVSKGLDGGAGSGLWLALALFIPVSLGFGNVFRTVAWPAGVGPRGLASATNLAAVPFLLLVDVVQTGSVDLAPLVAIPGLVALQIAVSSTMFLMFFRLQQIGGPTYLSQIGYVGAAVGAGIGTAFLGEVYPASVWLGAAVVAVGIGLFVRSQRG